MRRRGTHATASGVPLPVTLFYTRSSRKTETEDGRRGCRGTCLLTEAWVAQLRETWPRGRVPRFLIRDKDYKFGIDFAHVAEPSRMEGLQITSPMVNSLVSYPHNVRRTANKPSTWSSKLESADCRCERRGERAKPFDPEELLLALWIRAMSLRCGRRTTIRSCSCRTKMAGGSHL